jgi:hypothetical protein
MEIVTDVVGNERRTWTRQILGYTVIKAAYPVLLHFNSGCHYTSHVAHLETQQDKCAVLIRCPGVVRRHIYY